ncbi:MAG: hypothetical protein LUQ35_06425 [Methanoregula sp.]|jgi:uncharacterized cupredoxin-like copper-binding protein|nr:hypothetical protein [Methanoregula sp.]
MTQIRTITILLLLFCILCTTGCTELSGADNQTSNTSDTATPASIAKYKQILAQPEDSAKLVKMDTDIYNPGEVVEFVITNEKTGDLSCTNDPPAFSVRYQKGTGQWVTRMGEENPTPGNTTKLKPGESTTPYRFVTSGWEPGRYRIITDCGVSREILLRALPSATPAVTSCPPGMNTSPFIKVNPVSSQYVAEPFAITGTTSLPAGEELRYSIFGIVSGTTNITSAKLVSSATTVSAGRCGTNTWSVDGVIEIPGEYFIGISNNANTVSAVRRFTVLAKTRPTATSTLPEKIKSPGISTG